MPPATEHPDRLHALDAVRAFALLLGIAFHATMSFLPGFGDAGWPIVDVSPSFLLGGVFYVSHVFRMTAFFFIAGFFARLVLRRRGTAAFFKDRSKRILVPLLVGWLVLFPVIALTLYWGAVKSGAPLEAPPPSQDVTLPFPLTHMWFLYLLFVFYLMFVPARAATVRVLDSSGRLRSFVDRAVAAALSSCTAPLLLAVPVAWSLCTLDAWAPWTGIPTPDQSLVPNLAALAGYGTAFGFGWVLNRQAGTLASLLRHWPAYLAAAVVLTVYCLAAAGAAPYPQTDLTGSGRTLYAAAYGVAGWCWTLGITGAAVRYLSHESPAIRYLADASYWLYLLHLPLVFALQAWLMDVDAHWSLKYPLVLGIAMAVLLLSYDLLVRDGYIGEVLNGRRRPRVLWPARRAAMPTPAEAPSRRLATLNAVHKRYGAARALQGIDLEVHPGELVALLGPNGAGKSTAIGALLGLLEPDAGHARLFGQSPHALNARRRIGVMMQEVTMSPELKVRELVDQTASYYPSPLTVTGTLALAGIEHLADATYSRLSGGQKRQVQFALAICGRPALIFLDEPSVGLDVQARRSMWRTIRALVDGGAGVLLTTHYIEEAEALADRIVVLNRGHVIAHGSVAEIRSVVSHRRITCTTTIPVDAIRAWPEVGTVERDGSRTRITTSQPEGAVRRLLAADHSLAELEIHRAGLSDAFSELTRPQPDQEQPA